MIDLMPGFGAFTPAASGGAPTTTWNASAKNSGVVLTSADLIAGKETGSDWGVVQAIQGRSTGKYYFGIQQTGSPFDGSTFWMLFGVSVAASSFADGATVGESSFSSTGLGIQGQGTVRRNGMTAGSGSVGYSTSGDLSTVNFAVDMDNGEIWVNYNGTYDGGQDPATRTNPHTTFTPGVTLYPSAGMFKGDANPEHRVRLLTGGLLTTSPPSGYSSW